MPETVDDTARRPPSRPRGATVLLATIPSDAHTWNLVYLDLLLTELGCRTVNLGACTPADLLRSAVAAHRPGLVVISTVNGHGWLEAPDLARRLRGAAGGADVPLVIGGKLGTEPAAAAGYARTVLAAGFDAVFDEDAPGADPAAFLSAFLTTDFLITAPDRRAGTAA